MPAVRFFTIIVFHFFALSAVASPRPSLVDQQWYIENIGLEEAWKLVDRTPDVPVAVIDMDFNLRHPEMSGIYDLALSRDFSGLNFMRISDWGVNLEHGSMTAGLIAANGFDGEGITGVSKSGRIIALNIAPVGAPIDLFEVIKFAVDSGAKIINCSIGIENPVADYIENMRHGIQYAADHDVLIVASAGNSGGNNDKLKYYPANFSVEFENVISVGASTQADEVWEHSQYGEKSVDLFAPGNEMLVIAKDSVYLRSEGTSEAAPIVSGVAALMRQVNPRLSARDVKRILRETSDKFPAFTKKSVSGGRVNAAAAVAQAARAK